MPFRLWARRLGKYVLAPLGAVLTIVLHVYPQVLSPPDVIPTPDELVLDGATFRYHGRSLTLSSPFDDWAAALGPPSYTLPDTEGYPSWRAFIWDDLGIYICFRPNKTGAEAVSELTIYFRSIDDPALSEYARESRLGRRTPQHAFPRRFFMEGAILEPGRDVDSEAIKDDIRAGVDYSPGHSGTWWNSPMAMVAKARDGTAIRATADAFRVSNTPNNNCDGAFNAITFTSDEKWAD
jgi:hypothetical protein